MKNPSLSELRKESERDSKRLPRWLRGLLWCAGILALWCVLGFFAAPPLVRSQLEKRLSEQLHRRVTVGKVRLNPLTLSVSLESFAVAGQAGEPFIGWRRLLVNFDSFSFFLGEWRFQEITLDGFSGRVAVAKDGRLNFADLLESLGETPATSTAPKTDKKSWPLLVRRLAISDARLSYSDASRAEPFTTIIGPTTVSLLNFYTGGPKQAPGEFAATSESGESFAWRGALSFAPLRSSGEVTLGKITLKKYAPYYSERVKFDLRDGQLDMALHYDFSLEEGKPSLRISNGRIALQSLQIAKRGGAEPVVALKQLEFTGVTATWPKISVDVARAAMIGGSISLQRTTEGIDLVDLLTPIVAEAAPAVALALPPPAASTPPIDAKVTEISIRDLAVNVDDLTTPRPTRHELTELTCDLRNFSLATPATPLPFGFKAKLAPEGMIHAAGTIALKPFKAELGLELNNISLANVSPYAESFVNLRIGRGALTTALNLRLELPPGLAPVMAVQGDVNVDQFAAFDAASVDMIAGWKSLAIKGLEYDSSPAKLMISEITWSDLSGHLIVNNDGTVNLAAALKPPGAPEPAVTMPKPSATKPVVSESLFITLDRLVLDNAAFEFVDRSVQPNVQVSLNELSGEIDGLASSDLARASVDLHGKIDGVAPVTVTGKINPLSAQAFTDLKVSMKSMELVPVGPYVGKFAGYELARGTLNLDLKCSVAQRKVESTNVVTIDHFTFGNATNSPDATPLPVRLAVALLRDTSGRIVLDVPVQGSLDDPNFRIGRVVLRVLTNLLTKVATSPFTLISSMFGGGKDQDLSSLLCTAGETDPQSEDEVKKLDVVAKALLGRPMLNLEIVGGFDRIADGPALREKTLENEMRTIILADRRMVDPDITLDQIQLEPAQKMGMVRRLYYKSFPNEAPRHSSITAAEPPPPVAGQRGNLGAFKRNQASISRMPALPQAPTPVKVSEAGPDAASTVTETAPKITVPKAIALEDMKARLLERITVDDEAFHRLASERAKAVREYLVVHGQVPAERVSLVSVTAETPAAKGSRVQLRLK